MLAKRLVGAETKVRKNYQKTKTKTKTNKQKNQPKKQNQNPTTTEAPDLHLSLKACTVYNSTYTLLLFRNLDFLETSAMELLKKKQLFTAVLSQWDFSHRKFGLPSPGKASCNKVALPNLGCMLGILVFL